MRLDERLLAVAALVPEGSRVADIGSDHAYLAINLKTDRHAAFVVATDKNDGPCEAARRTIAAAGLANEIRVRKGDGLEALCAGEVDTACICGMGGELIAAILAKAPLVLAGLNRLVLQPMTDAPLLRRWLYENAWHITAESLAQADGRLYEIMSAAPGEETMPADDMLLIGPCLWREKKPYLNLHITGLLEKRRRAIAGMGLSEKARTTLRYQKLKMEIKFLEAKLEW